MFAEMPSCERCGLLFQFLATLRAPHRPSIQIARPFSVRAVGLGLACDQIDCAFTRRPDLLPWRDDAVCRQDVSIRARTRSTEIADKPTRRPMNVCRFRQISSYAFGSFATKAFASFSERLTVMVLPPISTPRKLFPATLNPAIRGAARTGGPSSARGKAIAIARISLSSTTLHPPVWRRGTCLPSG